MNNIKYRVSSSCRIDTLKITKESDHSIWIEKDPNRKKLDNWSYADNWEGLERKNTTVNSHFDTWEDAFSFLQLRVIDKLKIAESRLEDAKADFELIAEMKNEN